jgi:hypothetical protein
MSTLREIQEDFSRSIRLGVDAAIARRVIVGGIEPERRLQIYRNNVRANFLATMQATFPIVERLGGGDWFAQSVLRYQREAPSVCGDLHYVGAAYPQFLREEMGLTEFVYFADVARLEWAYQQVLTAAPNSPFAPETLGAIDTSDHERIVFIPRAALQLVESRYPLLQIWNANQVGADTDEPIRLDVGGDSVLLIRRENFVELRRLRRPLASLLRQFIAGMPLAVAAEAAAADCEDFDLVREITELLAMQVIAAIQIAEEFP